MEGKISCWRCKREISVFAFAVESNNISDISENQLFDVERETGYDLFIWSISGDISPKIKEILKNDFGCKDKYSKTVGGTYFANNCPYCNGIQGEFFLHSEPESPFGYLGDSELILHKISLTQGLISNLYINSQISPAISFLDRCKIIESKYII